MFAKLRSVKGIGYLLLMLAVGIILIVVGNSGSDKGTDSGVKELSAEETLEKRITAMLEDVDGISEVRVMITYENEREAIVGGIAVVCRGGENSGVRLRIVQMLSALFGIASNRIFVGGL